MFFPAAGFGVVDDEPALPNPPLQARETFLNFSGGKN
jgi:hypothetical protein